MATRVEVGSGGLRLGKLAFRAREKALGALFPLARLGRGLVRMGSLIAERGVLGRKPIHDLGRVGDQRLLAREIAGELRDAALELGLALARALFLRFERLAGERDAMQGRAAPRLLLA